MTTDAFGRSMASRRGQRKKSGRTEREMHPLVKELTGEIWKRAEARGWTREKLAQEASRGVATWYGWRNAAREPMLLDLQAFAAAVGLNVGVISQDASQVQPGSITLKPETQDVVKWMEGLSDEARAAVKEAAHSKILELASRPPEAVAESEGASRGRSSKN